MDKEALDSQECGMGLLGISELGQHSRGTPELAGWLDQLELASFGFSERLFPEK